jgi:hypothetical protein
MMGYRMVPNFGENERKVASKFPGNHSDGLALYLAEARARTTWNHITWSPSLGGVILQLYETRFFCFREQ